MSNTVHLRLMRELAARDQHGLCYYCKVRMTPPDSGLPTAETADHLVPASLGGRTDRHNIVAACEACNQDKADTLVDKPGRSHHPKRTKREAHALANQQRKKQARAQMWREATASRGCSL